MRFKFAIVLLFSFLFITNISNAAPTSVTLASLPSFVGASSTENPGTTGGQLAIGDINCDGFKDLIISTPDYSVDISNRLLGRIYVQFGGSSFSGSTILSSSMDVVISGSSTYDHLGLNIVVTDTDADGCDDIIALGAGSNSDPSDLYVFLGHTSWSGSYTNSSLVYSYKVSTSATGDNYSYLHHLGALDGDLDSDGDIDNLDTYLAICSYTTETCYIIPLVDVLSGAGTVESLATYDLTSSDPSQSIASGDLDGDGYHDLIVGSRDDLSLDSVHITFGPLYSKATTSFTFESSLSSDADIIITDERDTSSSGFGWIVDSSNIIDPDSGYDDLIIGNPYEDVDVMTDVGRIHFISGETIAAIKPTAGQVTVANDTTTTSTDYNYSDLNVFYYCTDDDNTEFGEPSHSYFKGDMNGDGQTDLLLGTKSYSAGNDYGRSFVIYGGNFSSLIGNDMELSTTSSYAHKYMEGSSTSDALSSNVVVGDVTGDGLDDVIIAASGYNSSYGITYVMEGEVTDIDGDGIDSAVDNDGDGVYEALDCNDNDNSVGTSSWYLDDDGDGYGDVSNTVDACNQPDGYVSDDTDCDDSDASLSALNTYYLDSDGDGYGVSSGSDLCANSVPGGYSVDNTDCNDSNASAYPGATEVCDSVDNNCDGSVDEGVMTTYYLDFDSDGYGDPSNATDDCTTPAGYVINANDCDDSSAAISPVASESCDGVDNNCDGSVDEGVLNTYYADSDSDGFGDADVTANACSAPGGYVTDDTDCDDSLVAINPNAEDICEDGIDNDCSGSDAVCTDQDDDGDGYSIDDGDCDDNDATSYPNATEIADAKDNDCDGYLDEGLLSVTLDKLDDTANKGDDFKVKVAVTNNSGFTNFDIEVLLHTEASSYNTQGNNGGLLVVRFIIPSNSSCSSDNVCDVVKTDNLSVTGNGNQYKYSFYPTMPNDRDVGESYFVQVRFIDPNSGTVIATSKSSLNTWLRPIIATFSGISGDNPFIEVQ